MAVINPPTWIQAASHPASGYRRLLESITGGQPGVMRSTHLLVEDQSSPDMSVKVSEGQVLIDGTENTYQGFYLCDAQGSTDLVVSASDGSNGRRDLVIARVYDVEYGVAVTNVWALEIVTGTPAATPLLPAVPSNSLVLATILVPAASTTVTQANITDIRTGSVTVGATTLRNRGLAPAPGVIVCTSANRPTTAFTGMEIFETDTGAKYIHNGSAWVWLSGGFTPVRVATSADIRTGTGGTPIYFGTTTPVAGTYLINVGGRFEAAVSGNVVMSVVLQANSVNITTDCSENSSSGVTKFGAISLSSVTTVNGSQAIRLAGYVDNNLGPTLAITDMTIVRVG